MEIAVKDVADRLGVSEGRVRQLIAVGRIHGRQVGREWLIPVDDVVRLQHNHSSRAGRPLSPQRAWGALDLLDGGAAPWLAYSARSQLRSYLAAFDGDNAHRWRRILSARSELVLAYAHPSALARIVDTGSALARQLDGPASAPPHAVVPAGPVEAARRDFDLVALGSDAAAHEIYVRADIWEALARALAIKELNDPNAANLRVRIPQVVWPFAHGEASDAAVAADLLESPEPRAARAGLLKLQSLLQDWKESRR